MGCSFLRFYYFLICLAQEFISTDEIGTGQKVVFGNGKADLN